MSGVELVNFESRAIGAAVPLAILRPPTDGAAPDVLCLHLHGGDGSRDELVGQAPFYQHQWSTGALPPMVVVTPTTPSLGYYMDLPDGTERWETFLVYELLPHLRAQVAPEATRVVLMGLSMGGYASLKLAFRRPELFDAVAALEPAILPGLSLDDLPERDIVVGSDVLERLMLDPPDAAHYARNHPAAILAENVDHVRQHLPALYIDAGDRDVFRFHDGAEFLHRLLWDLDLPHDYQLVRDAGHLGSSLAWRIAHAHAFLTRSLLEPDAAEDPTLSEAEAQYVADVRDPGASATPPVPAIDDRADYLLRRAFERRTEALDALEPKPPRRLGRIPPTGA